MAEFFDIVKYLSNFPNVKYIQVRRISTDTRLELLQPDIDAIQKFSTSWSHLSQTAVDGNWEALLEKDGKL